MTKFWLLVTLLTCLVSFSTAGLQDDVSACPPLPNFASFFPELPKLGRRLRICVPCCGIDGCGHALQAMNCPADMHNVYDLQESYRGALTHHFKEMGMEVINLNLGHAAGNILQVGLHQLQKPIDFLVSGPPCPPWAGQGNRKGCNDKRAPVFMQVIKWVAYLIATGGLLGCILENVVGLTHCTADGHEPVSDKFLRALRKFCPQFSWRIDRLELVNYLLPQTRVRVFIRGMRKIIAASVPDPLPAWGSTSLRSCLAPNMPHTPRKTFTKTQQKNIKDSEELVKSSVKKGLLSMDDLVVTSADRSNSEELMTHIILTRNVCPTLTTHNVYLLIMSVKDIVNDVEDSEREFFRLFLLPERLQLMGFPASVALTLPKSRVVFASGNAYPVPLIIATFFPMLLALAESSLQLAEWPPCAEQETKVASSIDDLLKALGSPGKIVDREKYAEANRAKRKRKCPGSEED